MEPIFFSSSDELRDWFEAHADTASELWVGLHKKGSGMHGITWSQAVDEALCVGWIDSVSKPIDETRRRQRFTPRRKGSTWSLVNVRKVAELTEQGRMRPSGLAAFEARSEDRTGTYSHERTAEPVLEPMLEARFRADEAAWTFFGTQAPSYRRACLHWVVSAKQEATKERRLAALIADSAEGKRVRQFRRPG